MDKLVIETLTDDERQFIEYYRSLSEEEKQDLLKKLFSE